MSISECDHCSQILINIYHFVFECYNRSFSEPVRLMSAKNDIKRINKFLLIYFNLLVITNTWEPIFMFCEKCANDWMTIICSKTTARVEKSKAVSYLWKKIRKFLCKNFVSIIEVIFSENSQICFRFFFQLQNILRKKDVPTLFSSEYLKIHDHQFVSSFLILFGAMIIKGLYFSQRWYFFWNLNWVIKFKWVDHYCWKKIKIMKLSHALLNSTLLLYDVEISIITVVCKNMQMKGGS